MYRGMYFTLLFVWLCNSEGKMWEEKNGIEKLSKNFVDAPVPLEMSIVKFGIFHHRNIISGIEAAMVMHMLFQLS